MSALTLDRLEIRDDVVVNGGTVQSQAPAWRIRNARTEHPVGVVPTFTFEADPTDHFWSDLTHDNVVIPYFLDDSWTEYRIAVVERERENDGSMIGSIEARGIWADLGQVDSGLISDVQADGTEFLQFPKRALTPKEHIDDFILPAAPAYFRRGTVEFSDKIDVQYSLDTAQSGLDKIKSRLVDSATLREAEIDVRRGSSDNFYYIDLVEQVGSSATKLWIRYSVDELALRDRQDNQPFANVVYPVGAQVNNVRALMASAAWEVDSFSGSLQSSPTLTLRGDPVWADDALNGFYAESFVSEQASTPTSVTDGFSGSQNAAAPENSDVSITTLGGTAFSNLEDANTEPTTYTVFFDVDTMSLLSGETITVHLDHNSSSGGTSWTNVASRQYVDGENLSDESLSADLALGADFDLRLRVTGEGVPGSQETDGFSGTRNAAAPENGDVSLTSDGAQAHSNLEDANTVETTYNVFLDVTTGDLGAAPRGMVLVVEVSDAATGGSFSTVATKTYGSNITLTDEKISFDAALDANFDIRVTTQKGTATSQSWTVTMHGEDNAEPGVQYTKSQSGSFTVTAHGEDNSQPGVQYEKQPGPPEGVEPVLNEITDSTAPNQITLSGSLGASVNGVVRVIVRKNSDGDDLNFLQKNNTDKRHTFVVQVDDVLPITNLAKNPFLADKTAGQPTFYELIGSPTIEEITDTDFWQHGGRSWKITAAEGEGIQTTATGVFPSAKRPHISTMWRLYVDSGTVRSELSDVSNSETYPSPAAGEQAVTTSVGAWIEVLMVDPQEADFFARSTTQVRSKLIATNGAATFYVDACSINPTVAGARDYVKGGYGQRLWQKATEFIRSDESGIEQQIRIKAVNKKRLDTDLARADFTKGAAIGIRDTELGVTADERILTLTQRLDQEGNTEVDVGV